MTASGTVRADLSACRRMRPSRLGDGAGLLFCGDNLAVLRGHLPPGFVDLVYLDPPFNSGRDYHFMPSSSPAGTGRGVLAFSDIWRWTPAAARHYQDGAGGGLPSDAAATLAGFRSILGEGPALAYLTHMAPRIVALHTALKQTGGLFLHCDPAMSHYLKILLDSVFGVRNFCCEIVWKRTSAHNGTRRFGGVHDTIFVYRRTGAAHWWSPRDGFTRAAQACACARPAGGPAAAGDVWDDIPPLNGRAAERLGYPTQKPAALLTRIISLATRGGDLLLDPCCGSGTAIDAAQELGRHWIGIDTSQAAIALVRDRLRRFGAVPYEVRSVGTGG